jgi:hypothetical protein
MVTAAAVPAPDVADEPAPGRARLWPQGRAYLVVTVAFVLLRGVQALLFHATVVTADSAEFRQAPISNPLPFVSLTGNAMRPWVVPAFYAVLGSDGVRAAAQVALSVVSWLVLAAVVATGLRDRRVRLAGFIVVLVFGLSVAVTTWDLAILSESLAVSLAVLTLAAWLRFAHGPTVRNTIAAVVATTLWTFTRPEAVPLLMVLVAVLLASAVERNARILKLSAAIALVGSIVWVTTVVANVEVTSRGRHEHVGLFSQNFVGDLQLRIVGDPDTLQWFEDQGMPPPVVGRPSPDDGGFQHVLDTYAADTELRDWVEANGQRALVLYSMTHPTQWPLDFLENLPTLIVAPRDQSYYADVPSVLPAPIEHVLSPTSTQSWASVPWVGFAIVAVVTAFLPRRRRLDRTTVAVGCATAVGSIVAFYLSWMVTQVEPQRHAVPFGTFVEVGLVLVTLAFVDAAIRDAPTPGSSAASTTAGADGVVAVGPAGAAIDDVEDPADRR